jgi:hypothetical protein
MPNFSTQPIEEFMHEFFCARIVEEQSFQESRLPFRRKFFAKECRYDSHADTLSRLRSEKVLNIDEGGSNATVTTEQKFPYSGGEKTIRLRYYLRAAENGWLIHNVQTACFICGGYGDRSCAFCKGKQWLDAGQIRS